VAVVFLDFAKAFDKVLTGGYSYSWLVLVLKAAYLIVSKTGCLTICRDYA